MFVTRLTGFEVRLVGSSDCSGRVEINHNETWGTVCDDTWDLKDAQVVCRQLRCGTAVSAPQNAHFGKGVGDIWLDQVACSGNETSLTNCPKNPFGKHDCQHSEDAGVICSGEKRISISIHLTPELLGHGPRLNSLLASVSGPRASGPFKGEP